MLAYNPVSMVTFSWPPVSFTHTLCLVICEFTFLRKCIKCLVFTGFSFKSLRQVPWVVATSSGLDCLLCFLVSHWGHLGSRSSLMGGSCVGNIPNLYPLDARAHP